MPLDTPITLTDAATLHSNGVPVDAPNDGAADMSEVVMQLIADLKRNGTPEQQRSALDKLRELIDARAKDASDDIPPRKVNRESMGYTSKCGNNDEEGPQVDLANPEDLRSSSLRLVAWNTEGRCVRTGKSIPIPDEDTIHHHHNNNEHHATEVGCPNCFQPIYVEVKPIPSHNSESKLSGPPRRAPPRRRKSKYAWVTVMYGHGADYFVGAMVLGWSLRHRGRTQQDMILLHTADVPVEFLDSLGRLWDCREVEYIRNVSTRLFLNFQSSRFKDVFTKLRVLELTEYSKVCLLDSDMLIRDNIDELFELQPPAALVRGTFPPRHGAKVPVTTFWSGHKQVTGINGGCMLLQPSQDVFNCMMDEVSYYNNPAHWPMCGAEQEYVPNTIGVKIFHYSGNLCSPFEFVTDVMIEHGYTVEETIAYVAEIPLIAHREQARQVQLQRELAGEQEAAAAEAAAARDPGNCIASSKRNGGGIATLLHDVPKPDVGIRNAEASDETSNSSSTENNNNNEESSELDFGKCLAYPSKEFPCTNPVRYHYYGTQYSRCCKLDRYIHPSWGPRDAEAVIEWMLAFKELVTEMPQIMDVLHALRKEKQRLFEATQLQSEEEEDPTAAGVAS
ncbi:hypothetical protein FOL47_009074 [Perkinsus chesapeaki]|uniref:Glycogenin n=1 Tax=Perkinsus chesapeaki TaxID=330153 RepID=A0A7J6MSF9_PERCH|nr:hypothetical protein FOL47_009074 [Perkinsus chesapeaki]